MQTDSTLDSIEETKTSFTPRFYGIAVLAGIIVLAGMWLVSRYVILDVARDVRIWQEKLNLIAESRASEATKYVRERFKELHTLSDNPSLQLYLTELQSLPVEGQKSANPPAQIEYLRNLLVFSAQRGGYLAGAGQANIPANIPPDNKSGIAVLNQRGEVVVSTVLDPKVKQMILNAAKDTARKNEDSLIDITKDESGALYIGFATPVYSIQGERNAASQVGKVIAFRVVDNEIFGMLKHPGVTERTLETVLVRPHGNVLEFLNPLIDRSGPLTKQIDNDDRLFVEARLMRTIGNFIPDMKDYAKRKVMATSRAIAGTPWIMIVKIERDEALQASTKNRNDMIALFVAIIVMVVSLVFTLWWYASSKRSLMMSYQYRALTAQAQAQEQLLRLVSDNQLETIYILDHHHRYQFANKKAAERIGVSVESLPGKYIKDVRGSARGEQAARYCDDAQEQQKITQHVLEWEERNQQRSFQCVYVPIPHIPVAGLPTPTPGVLVVEQDITDVVSEREKRVQINQDLIDTLVALVDRRDPFAANHSLIVSELARSIAQQMELDAITVDTTRIAASLMNIGKIVISTKLLTKTSELTEDERHAIRNSLLDAAELVKSIHFEGPVYDTLRQWQEKWDGSGMLGLRGEEILVSARIVTVANSFVGMVSPRSWRMAMSSEKSIQFLMDHCGTLFDRRVVVAMLHYLENHRGKAWLEGLLHEREAA